MKTIPTHCPDCGAGWMRPHLSTCSALPRIRAAYDGLVRSFAKMKEGVTINELYDSLTKGDDVYEASKKFGERNDCTVQALARVAALEYEEAHRTLTAAGRLRGRKFGLFKWLNNQFELRGRSRPLVLGEYSAVPVKMSKSRTLGQVLRDFPKGRLLARKRGHAFTIIDGVPHSPCGGNRVRVLQLWYFEKETV